MKPKIIFIHGMFLNSKSWDKWITNLEALGYPGEAPAWPLHEGKPSALRQNLPPGLGRLTLDTVCSHYRAILRQEPEPPILVGHSLGGLVMQKLIAEGLGRAGVGICPVAPNRMMALDWGFLRNSASITNPLAGDEPYEMTEDAFYQSFGNTMTESQSRKAYQQFAVHESRQVLRDALGSGGELKMDLPHAPMLFIGAAKDEIIPAALVRRNANAYTDERSHHEYREFSSRGHFICGEDGWEEVALTVVNWLDAHINEATPQLSELSN